MNGLLACPARQIPAVLHLVQESHLAQTVGCDLLYEVPGVGTRYQPCSGDLGGKWSEDALIAVAEWKNQVLARARAEARPWVFITDSDLLLHPTTIERLLECDVPVITALFWTFAERGAWGPWATEYPSARPDPDGWEVLYEPYSHPGLHECEWTGATYLLRGEALALKDPWSVRDGWGEDRWFARARREAGLPCYTLNLGDHSPFHIYTADLLHQANRVWRAWMGLTSMEKV